VNDIEPLLMFSRSQGRIRKLLRNVSGMPAPFRPTPGTPKSRGYGVSSAERAPGRRRT
jgi:hypothetical protein